MIVEVVFCSLFCSLYILPTLRVKYKRNSIFFSYQGSKMAVSKRFEAEDNSWGFRIFTRNSFLTLFSNSFPLGGDHSVSCPVELHKKFLRLKKICFRTWLWILRSWVQFSVTPTIVSIKKNRCDWDLNINFESKVSYTCP